MRVNTARNQIHLKLVYYGPGMSGKTTNLVQLHEAAPQKRRGELLRLDTETERTLFFDYFPLNIGSIGGYNIKLDLFTTPGQSFYHDTRRAVLEGADGVVFVADSSPSREQANRLSLRDLYGTLENRGRMLSTVPIIFQYNKRDVQGALPLSVMERTLNPEKRPAFPAVAVAGQGVQETHRALIAAVLQQLRSQAKSRSARAAR
ncbi:MAG: GTPase domain-containing protein [Myxococcota bacterium]